MANDFLPFATDPAANVISQGAWAALVARPGGFVSGVAKSNQVNKVLRQAAAMAAAMGVLIDTYSDRDALDDGDIVGLATKIAQTIQSGMISYVVATGTANAWVLSPTPAVPSYSAGRVLWVIPPATNTSTTVNANVSTLGNRRVKKADGTDPAIGDLVGGKAVPMIEDGTSIRVVSTLPSDMNIVAAANKSPFNLATVISTTRATYTGITGYQSVMSGTYIKKSATSNINVRIVTNLLSNAGVGAGLLRLVLDGVTHPEFVAVNMTASSNQTSPHGTATFTGRPAGSLAWAFYIGRPDANAWTSVFNPDSTNSTNLPASTRTTLSFEEVEP